MWRYIQSVRYKHGKLVLISCNENIESELFWKTLQIDGLTVLVLLLCVSGVD